MPTLGRLIVDIAANTSQLKTDLGEARRELSSFKGTVETGMGAVGRLSSGLLKLGGGVLTLRAVAGAAQEVWRETAEAERSQLRLDAVLKATGNASGFAGRQLREMADQLERATLFDDQEIQRAQTVLATFGNVHGQVFKDAIRLSLDLSSVFETDLRSTTLALAKALDQPAESLSALAKMGVKFSQEQRSAIESMVRLNDVAGAQTAILKALEERVGGTAGAEAGGLSGAFKRLTDRIDDAKKALGGFVFGRKDAVGLDDVIAQALRPRQRVQPPVQQLGELAVTADAGDLSKEIGGLTTLAGLGRLATGDITRLREIGRAHAEAIRLPKLETESYLQFLEKRVRLERELASIQSTLVSLLHPPASRNLGRLRDLSRQGASATEESDLRRAVEAAQRANGAISSAMVGVGGERGPSPYREFLGQTASAAEQWRAAWKTAIEAGAQTMTNFFQEALQGGMKLRDFLRGLVASVTAPLFAMVGTQIATAIGRGVGLPSPVAGSATPVSLRGQAALDRAAGGMSPVVVNQNIRFHVSAMDGASVQAMLRREGGTIAGIVAEAATQAPAFARHLVASGMRG
jgi:hypothetical protein